MKIETQRLTIIPLNQNEMRKYILDDFSLELSLKLVSRTRIISDRVKLNIETKILSNLMDKTKNDYYYTFWTVICNDENTMVADICFKGEPNEKGEIEIGYGTYPDFQLKGFMTEAIEGLISWAFKQKGVNSILAETDPNNIASQRVLEKNSFIIESQTNDNICWRINKKQQYQ